MAKKLMVGAMSLYVLALVILIPLLIAAAPGPENRAIPGVGIGGYDQANGIVYFSGKRLNCANQTDGPPAATCSIEIAGQTLTLSAQRSSTGAGGTCAASYGGKEWPCHLGWGKTVSTPWFVFVDEPLGLSASQMDALRTRYPIENLGETPFLIGLLVLPILNVIMYIAAAWRLMPSRLRKNIPVWAANAGMSMAIWLFSVFFWFRLTDGFWD